MRLARVVFAREVPSPRAASLARSHWITSFDRPGYLISLDGRVVTITDRETGRTLIYPWSEVAAAEPEGQPPVELDRLPIPPPAPSTTSSRKKGGVS